MVAGKEDGDDMDALVDAVLRGKRLNPFPRGLALFVLANLALLVSAALWIASVPAALIDGGLGPRANAEMLSLAVSLPTLAVPPSMVAFGRRGGLALMKGSATLWLAAHGLAGAAIALGWLNVPWTVVALGTACAAGALAMICSEKYAALVTYKQRLRKRRAEVSR